MAWSDAARRAAALVRKSRAIHKRYLESTGFTSHGPSPAFFEPNYRKTLAQKIRYARTGKGSARLVNEARDAAAKGVTSTKSRNYWKKASRDPTVTTYNQRKNARHARLLRRG